MKTTEISEIIMPSWAQVYQPEDEVLHLLTDSRRLSEVQGTVLLPQSAIVESSI